MFLFRIIIHGPWSIVVRIGGPSSANPAKTASFHLVFSLVGGYAVSWRWGGGGVGSGSNGNATKLSITQRLHHKT